MRESVPHKLIAQLAIVAMLMVSLVPTLTVAFPIKPGISFAQEVCSSQKGKLLVQMLTTKGKQFSTLLDYTPSQKPVSLSHHINHCPFCHMAFDEIVLPSHRPTYVLFQQSQKRISLNNYSPPVVIGFSPSTHTTRAPPF